MESGDLTPTLELIKGAQAGDKQALERLFGKYYERVRRIVRLRLGAKLRRRMESGDILQDTFMAALRNFDRFELRDEASFINWLAVLAENQIRDAADYHNAAKRDASKDVPFEYTDTSGFTGLDPAASGISLTEKLSREEQVERIEQSIELLPDDYKELIILRDYTGASWEDIARKTGRPSPDAARMMHAKALVELTKRVRGVGGGGAAGA